MPLNLHNHELESHPVSTAAQFQTLCYIDIPDKYIRQVTLEGKGITGGLAQSKEYPKMPWSVINEGQNWLGPLK